MNVKVDDLWRFDLPLLLTFKMAHDYFLYWIFCILKKLRCSDYKNTLCFVFFIYIEQWFDLCEMSNVVDISVDCCKKYQVFFGIAKLVVSSKRSVALFRKICSFWAAKLLILKYFLIEISDNTDTAISTTTTLTTNHATSVQISHF